MIRVNTQKRGTRLKAAVIKTGGSKMVDSNGLNRPNTIALLSGLRENLTKLDKLSLVIGGGQPSRLALKTGGVDGPQLAVEATRRHAAQLGEVMLQLGMPVYGEVPTNVSELQQAIADTEFGVAVGGLELGQTTDAVAMSAAQILLDDGYDVSLVVLSNIPAIYNMPPEMINAKKISKVSLNWLLETGVLINDPRFFEHGMHVPLDPIAVQRYEGFAHKVPLYFTDASNTAGVRQFLLGEDLDSGTLITDGVEPCFYS